MVSEQVVCLLMDLDIFDSPVPMNLGFDPAQSGYESLDVRDLGLDIQIV
jgi:hypothetical protein